MSANIPRPFAPAGLKPETLLVHGGTQRSQFGETSEAMFLTQGFVYDTMEAAEARFNGTDPGFIYSRFSNPTVAMFEQRIALLEGAQAARATASGMAAVTATMLGLVKAGDHVVSAKALFGSCRYIVEDLLPRFGVASTLVDGCSLEDWKAAIRPNTKVLFLESPTNPTLDIIDIAAVAEIAREAGAKLVVDNVLATPMLQSPLQLEPTSSSIRRRSISTDRDGAWAESSWHPSRSSTITSTISCARRALPCRRSTHGCC